MASVLPAINVGGTLANSSSGATYHEKTNKVPTPPSSKPLVNRSINSTIRRKPQRAKEASQKEDHSEKHQPLLSKLETSQYRNAYKHNLCLDMLQEGYHKSFSEIFMLMKQQSEKRLEAGPESILWNQTLLQDQPEKLDQLKVYLTTAESAERDGQLSVVYENRYKLARYFQQTDDKWLTDHFFDTCLETASSVNDNGLLAAEGHCNVGLALEESGIMFDAVKHYEQYYKLSKDKDTWPLVEEVTMFENACALLARACSTIAAKFDAEGKIAETLTYQQKAYDMAKEGGDPSIQGNAAYKLGQAYEKNKNSQRALHYLFNYLEACQMQKDDEGIGKACEAIAKAYETNGRVEEAIKYLEMYVEVAEKSKNDQAISQACSHLGTVFNSLGRYELAVEYFNKAYNISRALQDAEAISSSRALLGVAAAHKMLNAVSTHIDTAGRKAMERLLEWKDNRGDDFDKPMS